MAGSKDAGEKVKQIVSDVFDKWVNEHLRNSDFSQDTPAWNRLMDGRSELIDRICEEITK